MPEESWEGDWALAYHVLRQAGETLPWITLAREIEAAQEALRRQLARRDVPRDVARARYLSNTAKLDKLLQEYAFVVPVRSLEKGRLPRHVAEQQFDAAWPLVSQGVQ